MGQIAHWLNELLVNRFDIRMEIAEALSTILLTAAMIAVGICINWVLQRTLEWISRYNRKLSHSKWNTFIVRRKLGHHILLLIPGTILYFLPYLTFDSEKIIRFLHRADVIFMVIVMMRICNALLLSFLDFYRTTDKNRQHPLQGMVQGLQVILYFVGGIIIVAILIDKSPTVLLTGLGASAAVLMLIFKDSILGFVAGVQLSQNNMVRIGDWIQMPDGSANGTVEEITLNTVKVRNWDNTLTMIPPYTLVSTPFKNWRGMQESGGRRVDKLIYIDITPLGFCNGTLISDLRRNVPIMDSYIQSLPDGLKPDESTINLQLYRKYIEIYLRTHPDVNQTLDMIITQKESTPYGLPVEVYFFLNDKAWAVYERKQSDIFDHLMGIAAEFGLRLYQRP